MKRSIGQRIGLRLAPALLGAVLAAAPALAAGGPPGKIAGSGTAAVLTDPGGVPLYFYAKDTHGKSNCYDACAASWPPFAAPPGAKPVGKWSIVGRKDGSTMWAYNGRPVYEFKNDRTAGSRAATPISNEWQVARPS